MLANISAGDQTVLSSSMHDRIPCCLLRVAFEGYQEHGNFMELPEIEFLSLFFESIDFH